MKLIDFLTDGIVNEVPSQHAMTFNMKNWKNLKEVQKFLMRNGYEELGSGVYAEVWKNETSNKVVKISTYEDKCWIRYVRWVQKQGNNKYLPKIYSFREYNITYNKQPKTMFIAVMEILEESDSYKARLRKSIKQGENIKDLALYTWLQSVGWDSYYGTVQHLMKNSPLLNSHPQYKELDPRQRAEKLISAFNRTTFAQTARKIEQELGHSGCMEDLHFGNVMYRKSTNNLVITDPLATALSDL